MNVQVRERLILDIGPLVVCENTKEVELVIRAESGTYIKELVHSDGGRTTPSVAQVLGRTCRVVWLDVQDIHGE